MNAGSRETINALVLGVGRFGQHHARILAQLNRKDRADIPRIGRLIVTRTHLDRARQIATDLKRDARTAVNDIVPAVIRDPSDLHPIMSKYAPRFVAITARDKAQGDSIHADYAKVALSQGVVLCEKPFAVAGGDGSSLVAIKNLIASGHAGRFALELPMAVVRQRLQLRKKLYRQLLQARFIRFHWHGPTKMDTALIDDLALHPWSLLPSGLYAHVQEVVNETHRAFICLKLHHPQTRQGTDCQMTLHRGGSFRAIEADGITISFRINAGNVELYQLPVTPDPQAPYDGHAGTHLLTVENPLEHNIIAALQQRPVTGLELTYRSQHFLEVLHGFRNKRLTFALT